ncbi:MAG: hypothetical protein WKF40_10985 [Thermoleophilaceae bacterium]
MVAEAVQAAAQALGRLAGHARGHDLNSLSKVVGGCEACINARGPSAVTAARVGSGLPVS